MPHALSSISTETGETAAAYGNLGNICQVRGELAQAEEIHKKALAINEKLGRYQGTAIHQEGMANIYNNLGLITKIGAILHEHGSWGPRPATCSPRSV